MSRLQREIGDWPGKPKYKGDTEILHGDFLGHSLDKGYGQEVSRTERQQRVEPERGGGIWDREGGLIQIPEGWGWTGDLVQSRDTGIGIREGWYVVERRRRCQGPEIQRE